MNVPDPLFVCEHTALDKLAAELVEPCGCGQTKWVTTSRKQVMLFIPEKTMEIARTFMYFYAYISGQSFL